MSRKPSGYWQDFENVKKHLDQIIEELGRFPTYDEIKERDGGLIKGITKHHGGMIKIRELCGGEVIQKPAGYWQDFGNVRRHLDPIIEKLGRFPFREEIRKLDSGLLNGIRRYHEGINRVREIYCEDLLRKDNGYYQNLDNVRKEIDKMIKELGRFPTITDMQERNSGLLAGIYKHHGGFREFRKLYGEKPKRRCAGYWQDLGNVKAHLDEMIEELGRFPTQIEIGERNTSLQVAIGKYHGGINKLRSEYGKRPLIKPNKYWQDIQNIKFELESIIQELGRFPKLKELREKNRQLDYGIRTYHGGLTKVKVKLGYADEQLGILKEMLEELDHSET